MNRLTQVVIITFLLLSIVATAGLAADAGLSLFDEPTGSSESSIEPSVRTFVVTDQSCWETRARENYIGLRREGNRYVLNVSHAVRSERNLSGLSLESDSKANYTLRTVQTDTSGSAHQGEDTCPPAIRYRAQLQIPVNAERSFTLSIYHNGSEIAGAVKDGPGWETWTIGRSEAPKTATTGSRTAEAENGGRNDGGSASSAPHADRSV